MYPGVGTFVLIQPTQTFYERIKIAHSALDRLDERLQTLDIMQISVAVLDRWLKTLSDVELRALGHQDKVALEHSGKDGGPIQTDMKVILDALADPQNQRRAGRS